MITDQYKKIAPFILFILALILLFFLVRPMITILLSSILLAYISFPLYKRIMKKIPNKSVSIALSLLIIVIIILIPFTFLTLGIAQQGFYFYNSLSDNIDKGALLNISCNSAESKVCLLINQAEKFSLERLSMFGFDKQLQNLLPILEEKITLFILSIPLIIAGTFITLVITFFILRDWKNILKKTTDLLPISKKAIKKLTKEFKQITHTVIYAQLFIALVQGTIGTIGYYIFGAPFPIILGVVTAFFALIPAVGTAVIWVPVSLYLMLSGYVTPDYEVLVKGVGLFLYGFLIISTIDNILLAKIVHSKAKVNQISVIIGVIGGAALFGLPGIFIGPILLPLLIIYFETFKKKSI
jgi:predicted PurR-regulated permease PerM